LTISVAPSVRLMQTRVYMKTRNTGSAQVNPYVAKAVAAYSKRNHCTPKWGVEALLSYAIASQRLRALKATQADCCPKPV